MIDITTYINEGGFFTNTGVNKYIDIIKNFGKIVTSGAAQKELTKARWASNMPETKVYKKLYDLFNDIKKYEVSFDIVYRALIPVSGETDFCTNHWVGVRNGDKFSLSCDHIYENHPENNRSNLIECKDASELLNKILYYLKDVHRLDILRDTAKFTIK